MNCIEYRSLLPALVLGELSEDQRKQLEEHLEGCSSCRAELEQIQNIYACLDEDARADRLTEVEKLRLESAIYRQLAATAKSRPAPSRVFTLLTRLAAAILLFVLGYTVHSFIADREQSGAVRHIEQVNPSLAQYDLNLTGSMRFSAAGLKAIAEGRKAALAQLHVTASSTSDTR